MKPAKLKELVGNLTGKPVRTEISDESTLNNLLERFLANGQIKINWNELNEILLVCNKDRISQGFFKFFFLTNRSETINLQQLEKGVEKFRKYAMLHTVISFAYRNYNLLWSNRKN